MILSAPGPLTDQSPMPFGKHKGEPMEDVPCRYLHFLWSQEGFDRNSQVGCYIQANMAALEKEDPDMIWT